MNAVDGVGRAATAVLLLMNASKRPSRAPAATLLAAQYRKTTLTHAMSTSDVATATCKRTRAIGTAAPATFPEASVCAHHDLMIIHWCMNEGNGRMAKTDVNRI